MKKENILVLAKKRNGRSEKSNYKYLYLDKACNILGNNKPFHVCEDIETNSYKELVTKEDFCHNNFNVALLSFYYEELREVEVNEDVLKNLLSSLYVNYENETSVGYNETLLKNNETEVLRIWKLIEKWYNEDRK